MISPRVRAAVVWASHTPTFFQRVSDYAETVVFGFHVDSEGASSVDVCARVFVFSGDSFLLQQHSSELQLKPWFCLVCRLCGLTGICDTGTGDGSV